MLDPFASDQSRVIPLVRDIMQELAVARSSLASGAYDVPSPMPTQLLESIDHLLRDDVLPALEGFERAEKAAAIKSARNVRARIVRIIRSDLERVIQQKRDSDAELLSHLADKIDAIKFDSDSQRF